MSKMGAEFDAIFKKSWVFLKKYWLGIFCITFISEGVVAFANKWWSQYVNTMNLDFLGFIEGFAHGVISFFVISLLTPIGKSCMAYYFHKKENGENISGPSAYLSALKMLPFLLVASALWFLGTLLGLAVLIIPGLWFFFSSQFVAHAIMVDRLGVIEAFKRSRSLVAKGFGAVVIVFLLLEITQGIFGGFVTSVILAILPILGQHQYFVDWFVAIFTGAIVYVPLAVMYLERRKLFADSAQM
jgi:hypothetical protein